VLKTDAPKASSLGSCMATAFAMLAASELEVKLS